MIEIRDATINDLDIMISLGTRMHEESLVLYPPIDREWAHKYFSAAFAMPNDCLSALAEDDGKPIGMMTAVAGPYSFSSRIRTSSDLLFVLPEYRGGRAATKLVSRFKEWSDGLGAESATLSVATGITPERTALFFQAMGFKPMEMTYRRDNH